MPAQAHAYIDRLLRLFGTPIRAARQTGLVRPTSIANAHPASLSAAFGFDEFPLHTETAHWVTPARYLALYCKRSGEIRTETLLLDLQDDRVASEVGDLLRQGLFFVHGGRNSFYSSVSPPHGDILRFDPGCMEPMNFAGRQVVEWFAGVRTSGWMQELSLGDGDVLIVDNWRMVHARGRVRDLDREIVRGLAA